ncbi:MAG: hypothetical protein Q4C47_07395, partial [Planctomycetia bacterium]|nr:hypothetical protein [Planctomycetia bacterium]
SVASPIITNIQTMLPNVTPVFNYYRRCLVVLATAEEHRQISSILEKLGYGGRGEEMTLEVFRIGRMTPTTVLAALRDHVPNATVTY